MDNTKISDVIPNKNSVWVMYSAEDSDKYFKKFVCDKSIVPALYISNEEKSFLLAHSLDYNNIVNFSGVVKSYTTKTELVDLISNILSEMNNPTELYFNYSDDLDIQTDVLGHGTFLYLKSIFDGIYTSKGIQPVYKSADKLIYALIDKKTDEEIMFMRIAAQRALEILVQAFKELSVGMTEKQIVKLVHSIFCIKPKYFNEYGIVNEYYSWREDICPVVLVGPSLLKGGHATASDEILKPGYTIYFDFGVVIELEDGRKFASDIQRMGYALNQNESEAPKEVQDVFNTLVESIKLGVTNCTPLKKGYQIDKIVRDYIVQHGYPDYNHSTGHPIGETAHNPGTSLAPEGNNRSNLYLQENGVYTIEPRIAIINGGSIEEMVQVTANGGVTLCESQKSIYLI